MDVGLQQPAIDISSSGKQEYSKHCHKFKHNLISNYLSENCHQKIWDGKIKLQDGNTGKPCHRPTTQLKLW